MPGFEQFELAVERDKYEDKINVLQGLIDQLQDTKSRYENKRAQIREFFDGDAVEKYEAKVDKSILKVQQSIDACHANIKQLHNIIDQSQEAQSKINSLIDAAGDLIDKIFE